MADYPVLAGDGTVLIPADRGVGQVPGDTQDKKQRALNDNKYMFSGNRWRGPTQRYVPGASALYGVSEIVFISDDYWTFDPRFLFCNWYLTTSSAGAQEADNGNAVTIEALSLVVGGAAPRQLVFGGAASVTIADGLEVWSDAPSGIAIPPRTVCKVRVAWAVPNSASNLSAPGQGMSPSFNDRAEVSTGSLAAKVMAGGISTTIPSGNNIYPYAPNAMVAKGWDGRPVVLVVGTSIEQGVGCTRLIKGALGEQGPIGLGLVSTEGGTQRLPAANFAVSGGFAAGITASTGLAKRIRAFAALPNLPFTCVYSGFGTNDQNATASTWIGVMQVLWAALKAAWPTARLVQSTLWSRVTSTDAFVTTANQTVSTNWAFPAGSYWALHQLIRNRGAGLLDDFVDIMDDLDNVRGGGTRGKWRVDVLDGWATTISSSPAGGATSFTAAAQPRQGAVLAIADGTHEAINLGLPVSTAAPFTINSMSALAGAHTSGAALKETISIDGVHPGDLIAGYIGKTAFARAKREGVFG